MKPARCFMRYFANGQTDTSKNIITTSLSPASDKYELKTECEAKVKLRYDPPPIPHHRQVKLN